jgi:hypothetical protein
MLEPLAPLYVALVHYPVVNRRGELIASAITTLDLHDLARSSCTYKISTCYIVTPLKDQQTLSDRLLKHWCEGIGRRLHPERELALKRLSVVESIGAARDAIETREGQAPRIWASTARKYPGAVAHGEARELLRRDARPVLLLFGTAWGLSSSVLEEAETVLEPICGNNDYNHLSVRCAASILMDRLLWDGR